MFSQQTRHFAHENTDAMQRKPTVTLSARKPFGERSVNLDHQSRSAKKSQDTTKKMANLNFADETPHVNYPSYFDDICSKKEMLDEFWGVAIPKLLTRAPETPTKFERNSFEPCFIELPKDDLLHNISFKSELWETEEPSLPEIDLNFSVFD